MWCLLPLCLHGDNITYGEGGGKGKNERPRLGTTQPLHRIQTLQPANRSKFTLIFGAQQVLNLVKYLPRKIPARLNFFTFNWVFSFYWGLLDKVLARLVKFTK